MKKNVNALQKRLSGIRDVIIDTDSPPSVLLNACHDLYKFFGDITGVDEDSKYAGDQKDIFLDSGKALAPIDAARCVNDIARTSNYLRGLQQGITEVIKRFEQPVNVLYAGCGPYATLVVPLMTCFSPSSVKFTLMDINQRSLDTAKLLIKKLGLEDYVEDYLLCDAVTYEHPENSPIHLVVTETMQRAFDKEPQVALTLNLARQLAQGGLFIPERIVIDACLTHLGSELALYPEGSEIPEENLKKPSRNRRRLHLESLLNLTAESAVKLVTKVKQDSNGRPVFPPVKVNVPEDIDDSFDAIMLLTHISVFGSHQLNDYDSGLTMPLILHELGRPQSGSRIEFSYILGEMPGFEWQVAL